MADGVSTSFGDAELRQSIADARGGSGDALGSLLIACRDYLLFVANRELEPELRAKIGPSDVVQDTFCQAQRNFNRFVGSSEQELLGWLRRILINNVLTARRKYRGTESRNVGLEISLNDSQFGGVLGAALLSEMGTPSKHALLNEQLRAVEQVLTTLPADYQQVLRLRYWDKLPLTDIARQMDRSPDAVQKLWFRAIERFKREFAQDGGS